MVIFDRQSRLTLSITLPIVDKALFTFFSSPNSLRKIVFCKKGINTLSVIIFRTLKRIHIFILSQYNHYGLPYD